jgi:hypothetical protein
VVAARAQARWRTASICPAARWSWRATACSWTRSTSGRWPAARGAGAPLTAHRSVLLWLAALSLSASPSEPAALVSHLDNTPLGLQLMHPPASI